MSQLSLSEIDWTWTIAFRGLTLIALGVLVMEMTLMLSHYWFRLIPIRKEIDASIVLLAPPIWWTFAYHLLVTVAFGLIGWATAQGMVNGAPGTVFTYTAPFVAIALTVVLNRFLKYYSKTLNDEYRRAIRGPGSGLTNE